MVAPALLCLSGPDEIGHGFEDFVRSAKVLKNEMTVVEFQEPVVKFVFFSSPMSLLYILGLSFWLVVLEMRVFLLGFLLGFFPRKADVALLAEERFKVVAGYDLLFVLKKCVDVLWTVLITLSMDGGEFVIFVPL